MDLALLLKAVVLGIVEGLTEFLPISSTGHLILASQLLDFTGERAKVFTIAIQTGAILAVCWEYRGRLMGALADLPHKSSARGFFLNLGIAFLPLAVLGLLFGNAIKATLFNPVAVAVAFIVGGFVILWAERRRHEIRVQSVEDMRWTDAVKLGLAQAFALVPGTSRAGATIIGGLLFGLSRKAAIEFSFFLAIPTLLSAGAYEIVKHRDLLSADDIGLFAVGLAASFVSAMIAVRALLRYISTHDFTVFAWYRIAFGVIVLITAYGGLVDWGAGQ
ncbi:MAG: undecaprenyl-diphosphate phosphatase [Burkholderiales bacterium]|nr:undecaprenyl-diphosphate phosphatase [Burkholderiales bacterium]